MADDHACDVVGQIVMSGDARAIAEPDAHERLAIAEAQIVLTAKPGQASVDRGRADIDGRRLRGILVPFDLIEHDIQLQLDRLEVEAAQVFVIEEPAFDVRRAEQGADGRVAIELADVSQAAD